MAEPLPLPQMTAAPTPPPPPQDLGYLGWIAALVAGLSAGGYALKQWFNPKFKLNCEIESGASTLTAASSPAVTAPDLAFTIQIEPGEVSAPSMLVALVTGDPA